MKNRKGTFQYQTASAENENFSRDKVRESYFQLFDINVTCGSIFRCKISTIFTETRLRPK